MVTSLLLYLIFLSDYNVGMISIADWALLILLGKALLYHPAIKINRIEKQGLLFLVIGVCCSTLFNLTKEYFSVSELCVSLVKLIFYLVCVVTIPDYIRVQKIKAINIVEKVLVISVIGGISQYILVALFGRDSWPLYSLAGHWFGLKNNHTMFNNLGMMRARSFWFEPSYFANQISLLFILLLFIKKKKLKKAMHGFYITGILCANSISGYVIMLAVYSIYFINLKNRKQRWNTIFAFLGLTLAAGVTFMANSYIRGRVLRLLQLKDNSGVVRTIGGFHFLTEIPWYGVGIGNHASYYKSLLLPDSIWYMESGEFFNVLLLAIITMGYLGMIGLLIFQYGALEKHKKIFWAFMVTFFGWGKLYTTPIWTFLIIYAVCIEEQRGILKIQGDR